ncbi:hypothetical protein F0U61_42950 [Archangium violaceum]|uniref:hypothetical protein n=1 Tax=Archangium violaceum TaxID=83451 RepID=UPI002B318211|nr:hypothetical protein F0U61_42950 [Archangium violaceum]
MRFDAQTQALALAVRAGLYILGRRHPDDPAPPLITRLLSLVLLALTACPGKEPADSCNTREEALRSSECRLTLGQSLERHISFEGDTDWYSVQLPADLGPRSLLRVTAGYAAQSTAVNLSVSLLREDGSEVAPRRVDAHGEGSPRPVEFLVPFTESGAKLVLLLGDEPSNSSRPGYDSRNPYSLTVEVLENPDANESNDTVPSATPLVLTDQGGVRVGSATGYLATEGDVDRFTFDVPVGRIAYVRVTAPSLAPQPPPAYFLSYKLMRPDDSPEAEGHVQSNELAADLATARRRRTPGPTGAPPPAR